MGTRTFVNPTAGARPAAKPAAKPAKQPRPLHIGWDVPFVLSIASLIVFGLLMVYSASWNYSLQITNGTSTSYILNRQLMWAGLGIVVAIGFSFIDYHLYQRIVLPMMLVTLGLLGLVLFFSKEGEIYRGTFLSGSIQPSELAKLSTVIYLSAWLYARRDQIGNISFGLLPMMAILGITAGLILLQPDISAAATVVVLGGILFFLADGELRQIMLVIVAALLIGWAVVSASKTGQQRLLEYVSGLRDPQQASYHVQRAMEAVVRGGLFGVGIGKGTTKFTGLPVPWTDSIFAVITEETGILGGLGVIALFLVILWRGLAIAHRSPDLFGKLLAGGLTIWIVMEAIINVGVMVNMIPFAGNALPLISAGGSSMTMTLAAFGIIMNVSRSSTDKARKEGSFFRAIVDLRRRDGRRSVPSRGRSKSTRK